MTIREQEHESIRRYVESHSAKLARGHVLDYGCGMSPYRDIIEGVYHPFDRAAFPGSVVDRDIGPDLPLSVMNDKRWDAILCTQSIQYWRDPGWMLKRIYRSLMPGGWLVITGPTNWPEVEKEDLFRFTTSGIRTLLEHAGFGEITVDVRTFIQYGGETFPLGWGAVGRGMLL